MLMTVEVLRNARRTLVIPESALMPKGDEQYVFVLLGEENQVEKRKIKMGSRRRGEVEVLDGLSVGERVIVHGADKARAGQTVRIKGVQDGQQPMSELLKPAAKAAQGDA
jgi:membrane fusion protein (multidrug efflux system)